MNTLNNKKVEGFKNWCNNFYNNYNNSKKIYDLLEYYIFSVDFIHRSYGKDGVKSFLLNPNTSDGMEFGWEYEYNVNHNHRDQQKFSKLFFYFLNLIFRSHIFAGYDVRNIIDKLKLRISRIFFSSIPIKISLSRKKSLIKNILPLFDHIPIKELEKYLSEGLPVVFFSLPIKIKMDNSLNLKGAPSQILKICGIEKCFLIQREIKIIGYQHGGGYIAYKNCYAPSYELRISDIYYGWGLLNLNKKQSRYKYLHNQKIKTERKILWVERPKLPKIYAHYDSDHFKNLTNEKSVLFIGKVLKKLGVDYFSLPYSDERKCNFYKDFRKQILKNVGQGEDLIGKNDLVIFDIFVPSLIHFCIEFQILFICITSTKDKSNYTNKYKEWFEVLYSNGHAFFDFEEDKLASKIKYIISKDYIYPKEIKKYHFDTFINI